MPSESLFGPMFTTSAMSRAVSGDAWVGAMLRVEAALARAQADAGMIPAASAAAIEDLAASGGLDAASIAASAAASAVPVVPFVATARDALPPEVAEDFHRGATSQDILDTAMMLIARDGIAILESELRAAMAAAASLADAHRATVMAGRTLLQQAVPTSFGLKAAGWLMGLVEATQALHRVGASCLQLQLGGAAGTLASMGEHADRTERHMASALDLRLPPLPWHTRRSAVVEIASAFGIAAGAAGKVALDVTLLAQSEVGEVEEGAPGGSSAMAHKRNPAGSVRALAAACQAQALLPTFFSGMLQEQERAAGAWQAEWPAFCSLLETTAAATEAAAGVLLGLRVDEVRMRRNVDTANGLLMTESLSAALAARVGGAAARSAVQEAVAHITAQGGGMREAILAGPARDALSFAEIDAALDPGLALGSAERFIDNALAAYRAAVEEREL